jgi:hypothetical protein
MTEALDKIRKAFALAFNARDEEQRAAWLGVMRLCLQQGWKSLDEMLGALGMPVSPEKSFYKNTNDNPYGWDTVVPFGKHKGDTLGVIARNDRPYIEWLNEQELRSTSLRRAVGSVADWLEENPEE